MMGFSGFGKKAREFDIEKLAEDAKKDAEERNRANIGKPRIEPRHLSIFSFCRRVIYHFERTLRAHSEIDSICLSVPRSTNE